MNVIEKLWMTNGVGVEVNYLLANTLFALATQFQCLNSVMLNFHRSFSFFKSHSLSKNKKIFFPVELFKKIF